MVQLFWKTVWQLLMKLNTILPYDPVIMLLGTNLNELKTYVYAKTYTLIFIAPLFIIAKI